MSAGLTASVGASTRARGPAASDASRVVVLIAAHDEERAIASAMRSVERQTRRPDRMIVIADNCRDSTEAIVAARPGWTLWRTRANRHRKAGALNQALARLERVQPLRDDEYLLVMDADTELSKRFLESALACHARRPAVADVCATFCGKAGGGALTLNASPSTRLVCSAACRPAWAAFGSWSATRNAPANGRVASAGGDRHRTCQA